MAYIDRPLDNSIGTDMTLREGCDLINDNFEVLAADKLKLDGIESGAQVNVDTNIAQGTRTTTTVPITSSTGSGATLEAATTSLAGVMTSADKTKLDGIQSGAQVNVATNIAQGTRTATTVPITSSTGSGATLQAASTSLAGVMTSADKTKLDGIQSGAQVNSVTSVAGKTGAVTLAKGDVGLSNVDNVQQAPITRTITAGTGLSGGGNLTADRTLSVNYGTTSGTAAQGNDARLSDAREWTAETIDQAEAEVGTATTRRAFTAQRVRQSVVAWFNGISGALGRTILTRTTAAEVRSDIGLGTAATRNVGTGTGEVMEVGAFGLGGSFPAAVIDANAIADQVGGKSGIYQYMSNAGSTNVPYQYVYIQQLFYTAGGNLTQIAYGYNIQATWIRFRYSGVWSPWVKQLTANDAASPTTLGGLKATLSGTTLYLSNQ